MSNVPTHQMSPGPLVFLTLLGRYLTLHVQRAQEQLVYPLRESLMSCCPSAARRRRVRPAVSFSTDRCRCRCVGMQRICTGHWRVVESLIGSSFTGESRDPHSRGQACLPCDGVETPRPAAFSFAPPPSPYYIPFSLVLRYVRNVVPYKLHTSSTSNHF